MFLGVPLVPIFLLSSNVSDFSILNKVCNIVSLRACLCVCLSLVNFTLLITTKNVNISTRAHITYGISGYVKQ